MLANQFFPKSVNKDPGKFIYFEQDVRASPASLELPGPCVASSRIVWAFYICGEVGGGGLGILHWKGEYVNLIRFWLRLEVCALTKEDRRKLVTGR